MKNFFKNILQVNALTGILLLLCAVVCWIPSFYTLSPWLVLLTLALALLNAFYLCEIMYQTSIMHSRQLLPLVCYFFTVSCFPILHDLWVVQIAILLIQSVLLLLSKSYRQLYSAEYSFVTTLLLLAVALVLPDVLILIPALWIGFWIHDSMSLRTALGSLLAIGVGAIYFFGAQWLEWLPFCGWEWSFQRIEYHDIYTLLPILVLLAFALISIVSGLMRYQKEKNSIAAYIFSLSVSLIFCSVSCIWQPLHFPSLLAVAVCFTAGEWTYFASRAHTNTAGLCFLLYFVLLFALRWLVHPIMLI